MNTLDARPEKKILITVAGPDRPGITSELTRLLSQSEVSLLDIEQAVVQGFLTLHLLVEIEPSDSRPILMELLWKARELGVQIDFEARPEVQTIRERAQSWAVTIVREKLGADVFAASSSAAARHGFNIDRIERLSRTKLSAVELTLGGDETADPKGLRNELMAMKNSLGVDLALQPEGLMRRSKRLVIMDMDSTLIKQEVIDELARLCGAYERVAAVTERAMNGEMGFDESLRMRCKELKGAPESAFAEVSNRIELTPGAETLVKALKKLGYRLAVISGGFIQVVEPLRQKLGLDYAFANELEVKDGKLTGDVVGPIVNRQRKADLLESLAQTERISLDQVIAIGDGANDLDMLDRAGLGIAFNAKHAVQEQAEYSLNQRNLDAVLYLLGYHEEEVVKLAR